LMGLYVYTIKKTPKMSQWGILEVAGNYTNISAFCLYHKFGFQHESYLIDDCFPGNSIGNLPMILDISELTIKDIIDIVTNKLKLPKHDICNIKDNVLQNKIALYTKIKYVLENQKDYSKLREFFIDYKEEIDNMYKDMNLKSNYFIRSKYEPNPVLDIIDEYITYLYLQE